MRGSYNSAPEAILTRIIDANGNTMDFDFPTQFLSAAAVYDNGTLFMIGEYTKTINSSDIINNRIGWYVSAGYRVGTMTPHLTYSVQNEQTNATNPITGQPDPAASNPIDLASTTLGVRWDFDIAAALKVEDTHREDHTQTPYANYGDADLVSVAIDVVF